MKGDPIFYLGIALLYSVHSSPIQKLIVQIFHGKDRQEHFKMLNVMLN
jgi:hypothetical protein